MISTMVIYESFVRDMNYWLFEHFAPQSYLQLLIEEIII